MAEIDVVVDSKYQQNGLNPSSNPGPGASISELVVDVCSASIYGDLEKLRGFVERDGQSVSLPDGNGFYALQWAALNNFPNIALYIIEHGGDVNATDHRNQTALHWAAVHGSIPVADVLLQNGARVEAVDISGYRAVHVAAQYGQTSFLNHIIAKYGADHDPPDNDGRSPLHWASYKGYTDVIRLLLFRDAYQGRQDGNGYLTQLPGVVPQIVPKVPIHGGWGLQCLAWNVVVGHKARYKGLMKSCTPLHWAALGGNLEACTVLVHTGNKRELVIKDKNGFTPAKLATSRGHRHVAYILLISCSKDPGYIKCNSGKSETLENDPLLDIALNNSTWTGSWSQLCPTCKNNRWDFFIFVCMGAFTLSIGAVIAIHRVWAWSPATLSSKTWTHLVMLEHPGAVLFMLMDLITLAGTLTLAVAQGSQIARNVTTNELANATRYPYLQGADGHFRNPYNHGCHKNCSDFLIRGYIDDEIAWPSLQQGVPHKHAKL
ncbi:hypothetical protein ZIOFF_051659 [Zingiber officinale]|uniref:protein S-acyltransferase n=1 Tax=Zingiber officinale TaxID=94328 RepID=A0A8J5FME6_ZINOF|nr:hypothetical protein ZIOFF_051659 [Zingiber officinale]